MRALLAVSLYLCLGSSAAPVSHLKRTNSFRPEGPPYGVEGARLPQEVNVLPEVELLPDGARQPLPEVENPGASLPEGLLPSEGEVLKPIPGEHNVPEGLAPPEGHAPPQPQGVENPASSAPGGAEGLPPPESAAPPRRPSPWEGKTPEDIKKIWLNGLPETRAANWADSPVHEIWDVLSKDERFSLVLENPDAKKWPYLTPDQRLYLWEERTNVKSREAQKLWALLTPKQRETHWKQDPKRWQNLTLQEQETVVASVRQNSLFKGLSNEEIRRVVAKIDKLEPQEMRALSNQRIQRMKDAAIEALAKESKQLAAEAEAAENSVGG